MYFVCARPGGVQGVLKGDEALNCCNCPTHTVDVDTDYYGGWLVNR